MQSLFRSLQKRFVCSKRRQADRKAASQVRKREAETNWNVTVLSYDDFR